MSARSPRAADVAPPVLHNSGYGPPPVVYYCPGIGTTHHIDVAALRRACVQHWARRCRTPAQVVAESATHIANTLQPTGARDDRAAQARSRATSDTSALQHVARLATILRTLGALGPFHGLVRLTNQASPNARPTDDAPWPWLIQHPRPELLRIAWTICAVSYLAPPLLLWTREPSLTWWRENQVITLRWLGDVPAPVQPDQSSARGGKTRAGEALRSRFLP